MPQSINRTTSRLARETRGQEIAEAALVLPIVFMVMLGIFWFGQAFRIYGTITHAAREGVPPARHVERGRKIARSARTILDRDGRWWRGARTPRGMVDENPQNPPWLLAAKLDPAQPKKYPVTRPALFLCTTGAAAPCDGTQLTQAGVCVQNNVQLSGTNSTGLAGCGVSVTFQYPYQFWLPFTSLNNQRIFVPAQARMKMESQ